MQTVTEDVLQEATCTIAVYQGKLRNVHLRVHLAQHRVLNPEQLQRYHDLRGYTTPAQTTTQLVISINLRRCKGKEDEELYMRYRLASGLLLCCL